MLHLLALAVLLPALVGDQLTPKQAVAQLKSGAKDQLKLLKGEIGVAHEQFLQSVGDAEDLYESDTADWQITVIEVYGALRDLQLALQASLIDSVYAVLSTDGVGALDGLAVDGDAFPLDFYFGQGGALDDVLHDVHGAVDKELKAAAKRLKKTAKLLDKQEDVVLLAQLRRPDLNDHYTLNEDGSFTWGAEAISVHTIVSASQRSVAGDGLICVGGRGYFGTVSLNFGGGADFSGEADIAGNTWSYVSDLDLQEGNYVVRGSIDADTSSVLFNVGVP